MPPETARIIRAEFPHMGVLVLSAHVDERHDRIAEVERLPVKDRARRRVLALLGRVAVG